MESYTPVTLSHIEIDTPESVIIRLDIPSALREAYAFKAGQFLPVEMEINGKIERRAYSLCSNPSDGIWEVAVKRVPGGVFSTHANRELKVGDHWKILPPQGKFVVPPNAKRICCFAAGSGITPIASVISDFLGRDNDHRAQLFYMSQRVNQIMLKQRLENSKNRYMDRFELTYFLTQQSHPVPLCNGRIDEDKIHQLLEYFIEEAQVDYFLICGPKEWLLKTQETLMACGIDKKKILLELFFDTAQGKIKRKKTVEGRTQVTLIEGGKTLTFDMERNGTSILDAALDQGGDLPFACKGGVCCTCRAKLHEGEVEMEVHYGLEEDELADNYILTCQAVPLTDNLVVNFDI